MDPAVAWKAQFVVRMQSLVANCDKACEWLVAAHSLIPAPTDVPGAVAARANLDLALQALAFARTHLDMAAIDMLAAEFLGLGGGSHNPAAPLASIQELVAPNAFIGAALARLRTVYPSADSGCDYIDWGRGILSVVYYLLEHPDLPDVDALIAAERLHAGTVLNIAAQLAADCSDEATSALQGLLP